EIKFWLLKASILLIFLTLLVITIQAQDVIIKTDGDEIKAKVEEIGTLEVKYKRFDNEDGPSYTILKSDVFVIK
ncbi:MAG: hypothetical protein K2Q22_09295, partial [Cytophagales bacterium]|nr:hypothetical protein [Cytophagales bacterium]